MSTRYAVAGLCIFIAACTCREDPQIHARVIDLWGNPVTDARVIMDGEGEGSPTGTDGVAHLLLQGGVHALTAQKEGYIRKTKKIDIDPGNSAISLDIRVWPKPESHGLWYVGPTQYDKIKSQSVLARGSDLGMFYGVESSGDLTAAPSNFQLLLHTDLKLDEVTRLGYELYKLDYVTTSNVVGAEGEVEVDVNLWSAKTEIKMTLEELGSTGYYLIVPAEGEQLEVGTYAFHTSDILTPKSSEEFLNLHEDIRLAYAFEIE